MWTNSVIIKSANQEENETEQKNISYVSNKSSSNTPSNSSINSNCPGNAKRFRRSGGGGGGRPAAAAAGAASAQGAAVVPAMEEAEQE